MKFFVQYSWNGIGYKGYEVDANSAEEAAQWLIANHVSRNAQSIAVCGPCDSRNLSTQRIFNNPRFGTTEGSKDDAHAKTDNGRSEKRKEHEPKKNPPVGDSKQFQLILGLPDDFTKKDIKKAYKEAVTRNHPDKVASLAPEFIELAEHRMKQINEAYDFFKKTYGL